MLDFLNVFFLNNCWPKNTGLALAANSQNDDRQWTPLLDSKVLIGYRSKIMN